MKITVQEIIEMVQKNDCIADIRGNNALYKLCLDEETGRFALRWQGICFVSTRDVSEFEGGGMDDVYNSETMENEGFRDMIHDLVTQIDDSDEFEIAYTEDPEHDLTWWRNLRYEIAMDFDIPEDTLVVILATLDIRIRQLIEEENGFIGRGRLTEITGQESGIQVCGNKCRVLNWSWSDEIFQVKDSVVVTDIRAYLPLDLIIEEDPNNDMSKVLQKETLGEIFTIVDKDDTWTIIAPEGWC